MAQTVLEVRNLSKLYRLGEVGTGTLSHDLNRWWARIRGREDPFALVGQTNRRDQAKAKSDYVWALKDVNFDVHEGEILGIIGANGAGKSTLLKLISRITAPTTGRIRAKGRIASLLEIGTGMHPEMTARENIYLNGAILGMRRHEITRKFDDIIDFAGCRMYVDTPVKRFSSGMRVRLGFAVAAFLQAEILIVDEVLAVGDAEFQKKALGKIGELSLRGNRTVIFVSHQLSSVRALCTQGLVLSQGALVFSGTGIDATKYYTSLHDGMQLNSIFWKKNASPGNENIQLLGVQVVPRQGSIIDIKSGIRIAVQFVNNCLGITLDCTLEVRTVDGTVVFHQGCQVAPDQDARRGIYHVAAEIPPDLLNAGTYYLKLIFGENRTYALFVVNDVVMFDVNFASQLDRQVYKPGVISPAIEWTSTFQGDEFEVSSEVLDS